MSEEISIIHKVDVDNAPLPIAYQEAKNAIMQATNIDECKDWSDKAEALRSYARQAKDTEMEKMAQRIRARAMRRAGILLKEFDGRGGDRRSENFKSKPDLTFEKRDAAEQTGFSLHQLRTAERVSNIPEETFEQKLEEPKPPTLTALAELGTKKQKSNIVVPKAYSSMLHLTKSITRLHKDIQAFPYMAEELTECFEPDLKKEIINSWENVQRYMDVIIVKLQSK